MWKSIVRYFLGLFFGDIAVNGRVYIDDKNVLIFDFEIETRHGIYEFPILDRELPAVNVGYKLKGEIDSGL